METIIDTHSHIYAEEFDTDIEEVIQRAKKKHLSHILLPNIDLESIPRMHTLCEKYPDFCFPMMGLHPTSVRADWKSVLSEMRSMFSQQHYIAVGEIGIDLYWEQSYLKEQRQAFIEQTLWAKELSLPIVIHSRSAHCEIMECLRQIGSKGLRGVFHSFAGSKEELLEIATLQDFYVGINGVVTFKNSTLREVLKAIDLSRIVVETDAPYLAPVPFRGKRNESAYVSLIVDKLAEVYETTPEEVAKQTSQNTKTLFGIR